MEFWPLLGRGKSTALAWYGVSLAWKSQAILYQKSPNNNEKLKVF